MLHRGIVTIWLTSFRRWWGCVVGGVTCGCSIHVGAPVSYRTSSPIVSTPNRPQRLDHQTKIPSNRPSLFTFTSTPFFPLSPSLASFDLQTTMIKPSRSTATDSCTLSLTIQYSILSVLHFANDFLTFFLYLGAELMRASAYSRHCPRRLGPLSGDGLCIQVSLLLVEESTASDSKCVLLLFLAFCVIRTHRHPPRRLRPRYSGTTVHTVVLSFISSLFFSLDDFRISRPKFSYSRCR
jgi:hypothetical protein